MTPTITDQEAEKLAREAVRGLARQGFQRAMMNGICAVLDRKGRRCALGHLIPKPKEPANVTPEWTKLRASHDAMVDLQLAHDLGGGRKMHAALREVFQGRGWRLPKVLAQPYRKQP